MWSNHTLHKFRESSGIITLEDLESGEGIMVSHNHAPCPLSDRIHHNAAMILLPYV